MMLTYPMEYGKLLTPQPEIIYDKKPPTAVKLINIEDVDIALIIEKPSNVVRIAIRKIPPPIPKRPDENPTLNPIIPQVNMLNGIFAVSFSVLRLVILLIVTNSNKKPNIISSTLEGNVDATKPPTTLPIIPKIPN